MHDTVCTNDRRFGESLHTQACFCIFLILHSLFACTIIHSCLHSRSPCIHIHICFQFPVGESGKPWLGLCLTKTTLSNPKREGSTFLPENAQIWRVSALQYFFPQFWEAVSASPKNCVMQSLGLHHLLAEVAHCEISVPSRLAWIAHCIIPAVN